MSEAAKRFNTGKPRVSYALQFPNAIKTLGNVMEYGASKYGDLNWKKGQCPDSQYLDSGMRHLLSFVDGESHDPESLCGHLGHVIWNFMALLELNHPEQVEREAQEIQENYKACECPRVGGARGGCAPSH